MTIRLLIACGMLAVAGTASAQVHYYGPSASVYDRHVTPYYGSQFYDRHSGHQHSYSHGYHSSHAPSPHQYGSIQYGTGSSYQAFGYEGYGRGYGAPISNFNSRPGASVCPLQNGYSYAGSPQQYEQYGDQEYGSTQLHGQVHDGGHAHDHGQEEGHDHGHDHNHAHESPTSPLASRGDVGRLQELPGNQVPFRDQVWPRMQTLPPSDDQPVAPPALPPSSLSGPSQPQQFEAPLGNGPPPNTVPLSSPRRTPDQNAGPTALNI